MIPPFGIEGGLPLAAARAFSVAGLIAAAGGLVYRAWVAPPALPGAVARRLSLAAWVGLGWAWLGGLVWLAMETRDLSGSVGLADVWAVLGETSFGHLLTARLTALALAAVAFRFGLGRSAAALACLALALQAGQSHAIAMYGPGLLLGVAVLHLLAAGVWLGGLVPLAIVVSGTAETARRAAERFSPVGMGCVLVLLGTSVLQFRAWIGDVPGLVGTAYGWMAAMKIVLFLVLVAFACGNRLVHTPKLPGSTRDLMVSIAAEAAIGLAIVAAAGVLTELPPSMHVQKLWPFAKVPSLAAWREDPDYRMEAGLAFAAIAVAVTMEVAALYWRFWLGWKPGSRLLAFAGGIVLGLSAPHLSPLLVPATPTMFYRSPTGLQAATVAQGAALFAAHCTGCHGAEGRGDGKLAAGLKVPPADLTAAHLWMHDDGELFWWIGHGIEAPGGGPAMPAFPALSDDDIWALIDDLHAHNAGLAVTDDHWQRPLRAPDVAIACTGADAAIRTLSGLRGRVVRMLFAADGSADPRVTTVLVSHTSTPAPGICIVDPASAGPAYAIATGNKGGVPQGTAILIDAQGMLRTMAPDSLWQRPGALLAAIAAIAKPVADAPPDAAMPPGMKM